MWKFEFSNCLLQSSRGMWGFAPAVFSEEVFISISNFAEFFICNVLKAFLPIFDIVQRWNAVIVGVLIQFLGVYSSAKYNSL